jgi:hypothetical protein
VWIGTHAVVCDGVTVGAHSVIAAGAVVTRDIPPWSVVAGAPARVLYDRRDRFGPGGDRRRVRAPTDPLVRFDDRVSEQWPDVLARCRTEESQAPASYVDSPGAAWKVRPTCDAVEIATAFGDPSVAGDRDALVAWLQELQEPSTGLFPDPTEPPMGDDPLELRMDAEFAQYGILSVGYALEVLGSGPASPIRAIEELPSDELLARLDALPWDGLAWPAGAWVDAYGTAVHLNRRHHGSTRGVEALLGWLATRVDPLSGMWGPPDPSWGWLMPVNGFYRLTRGAYAQFGLPLPHPEAAIDTVAAHGRAYGWFCERERNACNVLDIVHPLWLAARQSDHRRAELRDAVAGVLSDLLGHWIDGQGFAFGPRSLPGLQGTEMWLSIAYLAADLLGESDGLSWQPRGVHRLEPASNGRRPLR